MLSPCRLFRPVTGRVLLSVWDSVAVAVRVGVVDTVGPLAVVVRVKEGDTDDVRLAVTLLLTEAEGVVLRDMDTVGVKVCVPTVTLRVR